MIKLNKKSSNYYDIAFISNTSWYLLNFRYALIKSLVDLGYKIAIIVPEDQNTSKLRKLNIDIFIWNINRNSLNPLNFIFEIIKLFRIYRDIKPKLVQHFTLKACLFGSIAALLNQVPSVVNSITGLGNAFLGEGLKYRIIRFFLLPSLKFIFKVSKSIVIFQNNDDKELFIKNNLVNESLCRVILSSGVDICYFKRLEELEIPFKLPLKILFPSRIIKEKGFLELFYACSELNKEGFKLILNVAGDIDTGNRSVLTKEEIKKVKKSGFVRFLGHVEEIKEVYESNHITILPSWREGLSKSLIEAASMEMPIITSNVPGCRDIIEDGVNGILVPSRDYKKIKLAIQFIFRNQKLAIKMAKSARRKVINKFEVKLVNKATISIYKNLLNKHKD